MQVVALFSYEDFIGEIIGVVHEVRVQDYYRVRANGSAEWMDYYVELAAERVYPPAGPGTAAVWSSARGVCVRERSGCAGLSPLAF